MVKFFMTTSHQMKELQKRLDHFESVATQVRSLMQEFLQSPHGADYDWDTRFSPFSVPGEYKVDLISDSGFNDERGQSTLSIWVRSHGEAVVEIGKWYSSDVESDNELDRHELDIEYATIDEAASRISAVLLSSRVCELSRDFQCHVRDSLALPSQGFENTVEP